MISKSSPNVFLFVVATLAMSPNSGLAKAITFGLGADDYGSLTIGGNLICTYDNAFAAGGANGTFDMKRGHLYDITIVYENRIGSDGLSLTWDQPGPASIGYGGTEDTLAPNLVPLADLSSSGKSGLVGAYYDLVGSYPSQTVVFNHTATGEGPIDAINNIYNNAPSATDWSGYGYFSPFEEILTGQIELSAVPLPSSAKSALATLAGLGVIGAARRKGRAIA